MTRSFIETTNYSSSYGESCSSSNSLFNEYQSSLGMDVSATIDVAKVGVSASNSFVVSQTVSNTFSIAKSYSYSQSIQKGYEENYKNDYNTYCYVTRCLRQKFKVYYGVIYDYVYNETHWGSGLFGLDDNWSYDLKCMKCSSIVMFLVPTGGAYYDISYYVDNTQGDKVFAKETNNNIIFI